MADLYTKTVPHHELGGIPSALVSWGGGIGFTLLTALLGYGLSGIPGLHVIGPMACAILLAVLYRHFRGYPEQFRTGIGFASKSLLRLAIILFGLKLNIIVIFQQGLGLLLRDLVVVLFAVGLTLLLAKWFKADLSLSLLLGIGTGICGAAAIAAVSPILKAKEEDTAVGAGLIALIGTVFAVGYTILRPYAGITDVQYGILSGASLHEIAHVALAAAPAGQDALATALLAKLGRVFLLVPLSLVLMVWMRRKEGSQCRSAGIQFPWFLLGFMLMSLFGTYVLGNSIVVPAGMMNGISTLTTLLLTMAMVGLGLNVSLRKIKAAKLKALAALAVTSIALAILTYATV
ncbi:putative sulfate exporter family transporter [Paenibacillus oenotherae]|uniref:Sulfate exporter family transporter n=1 Tax=Paenibacillus oenotherae TaxID=1435645 RepID=A0ABS7DAE9_9BACL|nr:putative sulfate exporter family transporter [Paenibacillus oenotherae]MBW7476571.1 putative sulfate exporter family transporter [Paenibacillus oenotherae]